MDCHASERYFTIAIFGDEPDLFRQDLVAIGPLVAEIFMFEIADADGRRQTDPGPWVYFKLTYEPSAQVS